MKDVYEKSIMIKEVHSTLLNMVNECPIVCSLTCAGSNSDFVLTFIYVHQVSCVITRAL